MTDMPICIYYAAILTAIVDFSMFSWTTTVYCQSVLLHRNPIKCRLSNYHFISNRCVNYTFKIFAAILNANFDLEKCLRLQ